MLTPSLIMEENSALDVEEAVRRNDEACNTADPDGAQQRSARWLLRLTMQAEAEARDPEIEIAHHYAAKAA